MAYCHWLISVKWGGGGGGGFRPLILETLIYELKGKARTRPDFLRVVLGLCALRTHLKLRQGHFFKNAPILGGKWAWLPRRCHMVFGLQTQPKSWLTGYTFWVNHYLEIVFSKISVVNPPPPLNHVRPRSKNEAKHQNIPSFTLNV